MKKIKWIFPIFYVFTFALTIVFAIGQQQMALDYEKITLPQLAPSIAALITTLLYATSKTSLNFSFEKNVFIKFFAAFSLPILMFGIGFWLCKMLGVEVSITDNLGQVLSLSCLGMFIGAIGEEIGWRGFLQVNLEKNATILQSSIITGLLWGCWHIGHYKNGLLFMLGFLLFTVSASIILRKILERTDNNLIISILFHFSINIGFVVFYKTALTDPKMILINGLLWMIAAICIELKIPNKQ